MTPRSLPLRAVVAGGFVVLPHRLPHSQYQPPSFDLLIMCSLNRCHQRITAPEM